MGAFDGALSYRSYFVTSEPPADYHDDFLARIRKNAFTALALEDEEPQLGWVPTATPLEPLFERGNVFFNQYIVLTLRVDRWRLPATLLKARIAEAKRKLLASTGRERLGRTEKDALQAEVRTTLKQQSLPSMTLTDMVWNTASRRVRFWTHNNAANELFLELFEDTFGQPLIANSPYTTAADELNDDGLLDRLVELAPEEFHRSLHGTA